MSVVSFVKIARRDSTKIVYTQYTYISITILCVYIIINSKCGDDGENEEINRYFIKAKNYF